MRRLAFKKIFKFSQTEWSTNRPLLMISTMKELSGYNKLITIGKINENIQKLVMNPVT